MNECFDRASLSEKKNQRNAAKESLRFDNIAEAQRKSEGVTGIWFIGHLAKGQSATLTITAQAIFPGIITNNANVTRCV